MESDSDDSSVDSRIFVISVENSRRKARRDQKKKDQAIADQLRHGNVDEQQPLIENVNEQQPLIENVNEQQPLIENVNEQQPLIENVNEQQPGRNVVMNPRSRQQERQNRIANMLAPRGLEPYDLNPRLPINERLLLRPFGRLPSIDRDGNRIVYRTPHFHFAIGDEDWTFNDYRQKVAVTLRGPPLPGEDVPPEIPGEPLRALEHEMLPMRPDHRMQINEMHELFMNESRPIPISEPLWTNPHNQTNMSLVARREIEPGIFEETYSRYSGHKTQRLFGAPRCMCQNYVNCNFGNRQMITVTIHSPNLNRRFSMTISRKSPVQILFDAYFFMTKDKTKTVFVAAGKRLRGEDTPRLIGMMNNENIYTFISSEE
ncbi:hypothetical protein ACI65C_005253 [Semiaphis heraclei]